MKSSISQNRASTFIQSQHNIEYVDDSVIKSLIKYDYQVQLLENPLILEYLQNRFVDSFSLLETYQRIKLSIENKPICPTCGKPVKWVGRKNKLFTTYCSNSCSANSTLTKRKKQETQYQHWGTYHCYDSSIYQQQLFEKCGVRYHTDKSEVKQKRKETLLSNYGTTKLYSVPEIKSKIISTNFAKYGCSYIFQNEEFRQQSYEKMKQNNKCGSSKQEDKIYEYLIQLGYNVERFYKCDRFPYVCDFYLVDYDIFVEYNGSQYHNGRPYQGTEEDLNELRQLQQKHNNRIAKTGKTTSQYQSIINTWTVFDVNKRNFAKEHNIALLEIYKAKNIEDLDRQIKEFIYTMGIVK